MDTQTVNTTIDETYDDILTCSACGCAFPEEGELYFGDRDLCPNCVEELTCRCERCEERIWNDANEGNDCLCLCRSCYDRYYSTCEPIIGVDETYLVDGGHYCYGCYTLMGV